MKYVLALDQGTTSSRAIVFDHAGSIKSMAQKELTQIYPKSAWVEHDPHEIWTSQLQVAREALELGGLSGRDLAAVGVASQRETTIVWDRITGEPVYNSPFPNISLCNRDRLPTFGARLDIRRY